MKIKNYTSTVPSERSRARIQQVLVELGATQIGMDVSDGRVSGMSFQVNIEGQTLKYRLPARVGSVYECLSKKKSKRKDMRQDEARRMQADRTAWKLLQDWVEVQASLIQIGMSTATEVFLPYMLVGSGKTQHTLWAQLSARQGGLMAITQEAGI